MWQSFIPGRFSSALDIIADGIGILIGSIFALRYGSSKK
jgi:VanZ family protein